MRLTVPFLIAIAAFAATVYWANATSFAPPDDLVFDILGGAEALAFRFANGFGAKPILALALGGLVLTLPSLLVFHLFRLAFGGALPAVRSVHWAMDNMPTKPVARKQPAAEGEVLTHTKGGDSAKQVDPLEGGLVSERGFAALKRHFHREQSSARQDSPEEEKSNRGKRRNPVSSILNHKPDFSALRIQASNLKEKLKKPRPPE